MELLILLEKLLWMIHKISRNNIQDLELIRILLLEQNIVHFQLKHLVKIFANL